MYLLQFNLIHGLFRSPTVYQWSLLAGKQVSDGSFSVAQKEKMGLLRGEQYI